MKLTNQEIANINQTLQEIVNNKMTGGVKFKLANTKFKLEESLKPISTALEGVTEDEEYQEIMAEEQEVAVEQFTEEELYDLPLSIKDLFSLKPIMKETE